MKSKYKRLVSVFVVAIMMFSIIVIPTQKASAATAGGVSKVQVFKHLVIPTGIEIYISHNDLQKFSSKQFKAELEDKCWFVPPAARNPLIDNVIYILELSIWRCKEEDKGNGVIVQMELTSINAIKYILNGNLKWQDIVNIPLAVVIPQPAPAPKSSGGLSGSAGLSGGGTVSSVLSRVAVIY